MIQFNMPVRVWVSFKTIIVCSVHSIRFVKYKSFAEIWFVKTSTRIVKYESRVVKSNPVRCEQKDLGILSLNLNKLDRRIFD